MTRRVVDETVLLPAAAALDDVAQQLEGAADDLSGAGRTAVAGAGQFASSLEGGAAVLSLSWSAASRQAGRSASTVGAVAEQAVAYVQALDSGAATALAAGAPGAGR